MTHAILHNNTTDTYYEAFRRLHSEETLMVRPEASILLGDYFFSLFAKSLLIEDRLNEAEEFATKISEEVVGLIDADTMKRDIDRIMLAGGKGLRTKIARICYDIGRMHRSRPSAYQDMELEPLLEVLDILHNASLIHDDAVDNAELRRGKPTINKSSGIFAAVQSGDWLLAETMKRFSDYSDTKIDEMLTFVPLAMCEGELLQQRMRFRLSAQTHRTYYKLINCKTAALFAASCRAGAIAGGASSKIVDTLDRFGRLFGIAFQIRDDVLDFDDEEQTGKKYAQDIRNGIFTLPILMASEFMTKDIVELLEKKYKRESDVDDIVEWIRSTGSLDRAKRESSRMFSEAEGVLKNLGHGKHIKRLNEVCESVCAVT